MFDPTIPFDRHLSSAYYHVTCTLIAQLFVGFFFLHVKKIKNTIDIPLEGAL